MAGPEIHHIISSTVKAIRKTNPEYCFERNSKQDATVAKNICLQHEIMIGCTLIFLHQNGSFYIKSIH